MSNHFKKWAKFAFLTIKTALVQAKNADISFIAGHLSFMTVLSLVPLIAVIMSVFQLFDGLDYAYKKLMPYILNQLSHGAGPIVEQKLMQFIRKTHSKTLGWLGFIGLFASAYSMYDTVATAFNRLWSVDRRLAIYEKPLRFLLISIIGPILLGLSLAITAFVTTYAKHLSGNLYLVASFSTSLLVSFALYLLVYSLVPMARISLKHIYRGALVATVLLETAKYSYAFYTKRVVTYSKFYGSFAALPMFLLWIYIAWLITLFGAVIIRSLQVRANQKGAGTSLRK